MAREQCTTHNLAATAAATSAPSLANDGYSLALSSSTPAPMADAVTFAAYFDGGSTAYVTCVPWQYFPWLNSGVWVPGKPTVLGDTDYNQANDASGSVTIFTQAGATRFYMQYVVVGGSPTNVYGGVALDERREVR